jgi:hypothetical protein
MIASQICLKAWIRDDAGVEPVAHRREIGMPRQFGLKASSVAAPSVAAASSSATPGLSGSVSVSNGVSPAGSPAPTLAAQGAELPLAPASWRGCHGRRSISQH